MVDLNEMSKAEWNDLKKILEDDIRHLEGYEEVVVAKIGNILHIWKAPIYIYYNIDTNEMRIRGKADNNHNRGETSYKDLVLVYSYIRHFVYFYLENRSEDIKY